MCNQIIEIYVKLLIDRINHPNFYKLLTNKPSDTRRYYKMLLLRCQWDLDQFTFIFIWNIWYDAFQDTNDVLQIIYTILIMTFLFSFFIILEVLGTFYLFLEK